MRRISVLIIALLAVVSLANANEWKSFGAGVSLTETTKISDILSQPEKYVGQKVLVEGRVVDVCKKRGCWMEIASDKEFQTIKVKVNDGEIVFPLEGKGHQTLVEGTVEKLEISKEQMIKQMKHHAEESGKTFDPSSVTEGRVIYRIRGLGAKIKFSK